eukprot:673107-Pelagomonas_calceolata.AAC.6
MMGRVDTSQLRNAWLARPSPPQRELQRIQASHLVDGCQVNSSRSILHHKMRASKESHVWVVYEGQHGMPGKSVVGSLSGYQRQYQIPMALLARHNTSCSFALNIYAPSRLLCAHCSHLVVYDQLLKARNLGQGGQAGVPGRTRDTLSRVTEIP